MTNHVLKYMNMHVVNLNSTYNLAPVLVHLAVSLLSDGPSSL